MSWWDEIRTVDVLEAAERLALEPAAGRGRTATWRLGHGDCPGEHSDGRAAVHFASAAGRLRCRICERTFDALALLELYEGIHLPEDPRTWAGDATVDRVRAVAADLGWCAPDPGADRRADPTADRVRAARRQAAEDAAAREIARRRVGRIATGLDVTLAWSELMRIEAGRDRVARWAEQVRRLPAELLPHLPWHDLAAVPSRTMHVGAAGAELLRIAQRRHRHLLIAMRDGRGEVQSARTRWHLAGAPPTGPKALGLAVEPDPEGRRPHIQAGPVAEWPGAIATFGSLEVAIDELARGRTVVLVEGGPDFVTAAALCGWSRLGTAIGYASDVEIARLADWLRAEIRARLGAGAARPRIVLVPHNDSGKGGARARAAAEKARRALRWVADVRLVHLPLDQDLNDQASALGAAGLWHLVFGEGGEVR